jgi:hypothetical protein
MSANTLTNAKKEKNDEFYTQIRDIEHELCHYKEQLHDKVIFCNCDDPVESNFWRYFALKFKHLGLKKLIATHFEATKPSYKLELTGDMDENGEINDNDIIKTTLRQNGDFRSPECIDLLRESDIVITNPPFSLFREYIAQLMEYNKQFLIIGSTNAITYKEIFSLIKNNKIWMGHGFANGNAYFRINPKDKDQYANGVYNPETGLVKFRNVTWYTNLDLEKRHENMVLYKRCTSQEYQKYENYDAIEVSKVADIPQDYDGLMGVPITFLDHYNPEQFEIIGSSLNVGSPMSEYAEKGTYRAGGMRFYLPNCNGTYRRLYDRIVIKNKQFSKE